MIVNPTLPDGWTSEEWNRCLVITAPDRGGSVTLDFEKRGFRAGVVVHGRLTSQMTYAGRGWMQRLLDDAVLWLQHQVSP